MTTRPLRRPRLQSLPHRSILLLSSLLFSLSLLSSSRVMPASRGVAPALPSPVVQPQYPVRAVNGFSYRCDDSTSAPELWLEVQWEEEDEHGNHTVTHEPWAAMQDVPIAAMYMAQPAVTKNVRRLREIAQKRHTKNLKEAAAILAFEVQQCFFISSPTLVHHVRASRSNSRASLAGTGRGRRSRHRTTRDGHHSAPA